MNESERLGVLILLSVPLVLVQRYASGHGTCYVRGMSQPHIAIMDRPLPSESTDVTSSSAY